MIHLSTDARFTILLPNTNKALAEAIRNATPEQLSALREGNDPKTLLASLFQDKISASKSDQILLQILKNAPVFKTMGNFSEQLNSLLTELKTLPGFARKTEGLEDFIRNFAVLEGKTLRSQLEQSGVFLESKMAHALRDSLSGDLLQEVLDHDLKSQLLELSEELRNSSQAPEVAKNVDKLLTIIDYHQLVSHLGGSNSIYFPFSWDLLEEGSLAFKKGKEKKFYCEIDLRLREYGGLNLMMALYDDKRLDIRAYTETGELKTLISENMPMLRTLLSEAGVIPGAIRVFDKREISTPEQESYTADGFGSDTGFEVTA